MEKMDFYHFINSVDMQKYLRDISYQFSISEATFIVYWSKQVTLKEKISAWRYMISSMPDCAFQSIEFKSYHSFLKSYIRLVEQDIELFYANPDGKSIYSYECHEPNGDNWYGKGEPFFSDYQSCYADIQKELSDSEEGAIDKIRVYKDLLGEHSRTSALLINSGFEVLKIDSYHEDINDVNILCAIEECCFNFPSPFQRGDIVASYAMKTEPQHRPFVLRYMTTWDSKELAEKGFCCDCELPWGENLEEHNTHITRLLNRGDCTDMHAVGYCVDCESGVVYLDNTLIPVIDLEYYHGSLEGFERQLKLFSCYEQRKASNIPVDAEMLVNGCFAIRTKELAKKFASKATAGYYDEELLQLGVIRDAEESSSL